MPHAVAFLYTAAHGMRSLVIPKKDVSEFKKLLAAFYEGEAMEAICKFMKEKCWKSF